VSCPSCQRALRAPRRLAGRRIRCRGCGGPVSVPGTPPADKSAPPRPRPKTAPPPSGRWVIAFAVGLAFGLVLGLVLGAGLAVYRLQGPSAAPAPAPVDPPAAPTMTLSNPRRVETAADKSVYAVDYAFAGGTPPAGRELFLVTRAASGRGELRLNTNDLPARGAVVFRQLFAYTPLSGPMEIFVERARGPGGRDRVSNVVTLD